MRVVRHAAWVVLCLCLAHVAASPAAGEDSGATRWGDEVALRHHLDAACDAVEEVCGTLFGTRPTLSVSTPEVITRILRERMGGEMGMLEATPDEKRLFLAYYDPIAHQIHILPGMFERVATYYATPALLEESVLRAVLVHEATHALDFQRFPVRWTLSCCAASDERLATEAALEGHAQFVTEEVCRRWGIESAYERLTQLYTGAMVPADAPEYVGFDQEAAFAYVQGHSFVRAIHAMRGRAGVNAMLRDPPYETRVVDRPALWLEPARRGTEVDLQAVLEVFRPLVPAADWEIAKWRVLGPAVPTTTRGASTTPAESYLDNHGLYAGTSDGNRYFNVFIAYCRSEEDATRFAQALRGVDEARDKDPRWQRARRTEGAGPNGKLPGFTSRRRAAGGAAHTELSLQVVHQRAHVIELSSYGMPTANRATQARTLELAARLLRASPSSAAAIALRAHVLRFLTARSGGRARDAAVILRDLLPTGADLRRTVRPDVADTFANGYSGIRLALRTSEVQNATVDTAFTGAATGASIRAWAATTEDLANGRGWAEKFPEAMRAFAKKHGAPGLTWILLTLEPEEGATQTYACFARFGDRFLFIKDPWTVLR